MSRKFGKYREVDSMYLNVPVKYCLNYKGANESGEDKFRVETYDEWVERQNKWISENNWANDFIHIDRETYEYLKKNGYLKETMVKKGKDKILCIVDFYGKDKALVAWRNCNTCKMGMTHICKLVWKGNKLYLKYKDNLIQLSDTGGWVL